MNREWDKPYSLKCHSSPLRSSSFSWTAYVLIFSFTVIQITTIWKTTWSLFGAPGFSRSRLSFQNRSNRGLGWLVANNFTFGGDICNLRYLWKWNCFWETLLFRKQRFDLSFDGSETVGIFILVQILSQENDQFWVSLVFSKPFLSLQGVPLHSQEVIFLIVEIVISLIIVFLSPTVWSWVNQLFRVPMSVWALSLAQRSSSNRFLYKLYGGWFEVVDGH